MGDKSYDIVPFQKVGEISFEDTREQVRSKIGGVIMDGEYDFEDVFELYDYFPDSDIKVLYDRSERLGAVEFYRGKILFEGIDIFSSSFEELEKLFKKFDSNLDTGRGITSYKYGVGVCADSEGDLVMSVIVFKKDYYD